jgi:acyl carrier protein
MNSDFLRAIEEILDVTEGSLTEKSDYNMLPDWDSLAALSVLVKIEDLYHKVIDPSLLKECKSIGELIERINGD